MEIKYIFIYLFLIYKILIVKSDNESAHCLLVTKLNCTKQNENTILYNNIDTFVNLNISNDGFYYFDVFNYENKSRICDISRVVTLTPQIPSFPIIPTTGGEFSFIYNFPCTFIKKDIKYIYLDKSRYQGNWRVDLIICDNLYKSFNYQLLPLIKEFDGLLNENGGNITLLGNNLRYNVTGFFGIWFSNSRFVNIRIHLIESFRGPLRLPHNTERRAITAASVNNDNTIHATLLVYGINTSVDTTAVAAAMLIALLSTIAATTTTTATTTTSNSSNSTLIFKPITIALYHLLA
ncbi:hypothetical protein ACTFIY_010501 [Dictyostelium cf. discoideum]